jgi:hypothetical protein
MRHYTKSHGVSTGRQLGEIAYLWTRNGIGPLEYYSLGLFRPRIPWREKRNMVSGAWYWNTVQKINPPELRVIATNKIASSLYLRSAGIPTPRTHGVLDRADGASFDGAPLRDGRDLGALVTKRTLTRVCFKPISAWSGRGFVKVAFEGGGAALRVLVEPSGPASTLDDFCRGLLDEAGEGGYLVQDVVEQHPDLARFHPTSLNTIRTWMVQAAPDRWEVFCATLRMGVGGMTIDNTSSGGIGAPIDIGTGRLGLAVQRGLQPERGDMMREYAEHPTTGVRIDGEVLQMWGDVVSLCRRTASHFHFYGFMGVDIGVGTEYPWVVEIEADPHSTIQAHCGVGLRPMLETLLNRRLAP